MPRSRIDFDSFSVVISDGWGDITDSVEADDPPYTLAHRDGVGALQFSIALYTGGTIPDPSLDDLSEMVVSFGEDRGLGEPTDLVRESGPLRLSAGSFATFEDFIRIWQVSDGQSFAFVTYLCDSAQERRELKECERIVRSLRFGSPAREV